MQHLAACKWKQDCWHFHRPASRHLHSLCISCVVGRTSIPAAHFSTSYSQAENLQEGRREDYKLLYSIPMIPTFLLTMRRTLFLLAQDHHKEPRLRRISLHGPAPPARPLRSTGDIQSPSSNQILYPVTELHLLAHLNICPLISIPSYPLLAHLDQLHLPASPSNVHLKSALSHSLISSLPGPPCCLHSVIRCRLSSLLV